MSPYARQQRHALSRPLSLAQQRVLVALVRACPELGGEVGVVELARVSGVKANAVVLALHGLARRRLAVHHAEPPEAWSPTISGRGMARYVRAGEPRSAPVSRSPKRDE